MSPKLITALNKQANQELNAAQAYLAMAYWCEVHHSSGFAKFFHEQAAEEQSHAGKILKHLADRDVVPAIGALTAPPVSFKELTDVAQAAYDLERANTAGIHATYETALAEKDYPAQVLLHWFISEQVEEEAWSDKLLVKTREATCAGALSSLDRHLSKILSGDSAGD
ncbi:MAG: ferritin [Verrucomicrobiota bacterium]|jgi:ferritin